MLIFAIMTVKYQECCLVQLLNATTIRTARPVVLVSSAANVAELLATLASHVVAALIFLDAVLAERTLLVVVLLHILLQQRLGFFHLMLRANMAEINRFFAFFAVVSIARPTIENPVLNYGTDVAAVGRFAVLYIWCVLNYCVPHVVE